MEGHSHQIKKSTHDTILTRYKSNVIESLRDKILTQ